MPEDRQVSPAEAHAWAGYPVIARMSFSDAFSVYRRMRDMADALRWPWQRKRRQRLRFDAGWLFSVGGFYDADPDRAGGPVEVWVWPQREQRFATAYRQVNEQRREAWRSLGPSNFNDRATYERLRAAADRAFEQYDEFESARRQARERWSRVRRTGGFAIPPDD